jgi:hypothetical protein
MIHPKQFPYYPEHVPKELKTGRFWVCCDADKVPLVAWETYRASSTNPDTWRHYDEVTSAFRARPERYSGVGRVITDRDDYVGIDLDDVRDPDTRELLSPEAIGILVSLDSYSEVSPSGRGVKVWVKARLDRSYVKPGLEIYQRGRYFTVTGQFLPRFPLAILDRQHEVEALIERQFPTTPRRAPTEAYDGPQVALVEYLDTIEVLGEVPDGTGVKFRIRCPWISEHGAGAATGTYIGQRHDGGLWFQCWHAHWSSRGWVEFRQAVRLRAKKLTLIKKGTYA